MPLALKQSVSSKNAREGDAVYAVTTFPVVINDRIVIPAGTYVQGRISGVKRAGHIKGRAEVLMHFSTLIYPSGYTVVLPGAIENVPGAEKTSMKDEEGTIRQDSQTGEKAKTVATAAATGAVIGGLSNGVKGGMIGACIGGGVGTAIGRWLGLLSIWTTPNTDITTGVGLISAGLAFALQQVILSLAAYFVILRGDTFGVGDRITLGKMEIAFDLS